MLVSTNACQHQCLSAPMLVSTKRVPPGAKGSNSSAFDTAAVYSFVISAAVYTAAVQSGSDHKIIPPTEPPQPLRLHFALPRLRCRRLVQTAKQKVHPMSAQSSGIVLSRVSRNQAVSLHPVSAEIKRYRCIPCQPQGHSLKLKGAHAVLWQFLLVQYRSKRTTKRYESAADTHAMFIFKLTQCGRRGNRGGGEGGLRWWPWWRWRWWW
jgi:hypothetical protein